MVKIKVAEIPNQNWNMYQILDTSMENGLTIREYLLYHDIEWKMANDGSIRTADLLFFKGVMDYPPHPRKVFKAFSTEIFKRLNGKPFLTVMCEPREHCRLSYIFSDKDASLCAAPDDKLHRIFLPLDWMDPRTEEWNKRQDRFCWIGRPMPDRVRVAKELVKNGVELDIYSKNPWPLECWKGFAPDDYQTALDYKYRIVFENYPTHRYHSEKLFLSIRSGCVTFYRGDPKLDIPGIRELFVPYSMDNIVKHAYDENAILDKMDRFMHSDAWKIYSHQNRMDTIIKKIHERIDAKSA